MEDCWVRFRDDFNMPLFDVLRRQQIVFTQLNESGCTYFGFGSLRAVFKYLTLDIQQLTSYVVLFSYRLPQ